MKEKVLILDFGGQYNQLIARRIREAHVYAEICAYNEITLEEIVAREYGAVVFTGGPNSVYGDNAPRFDAEILNAGIPILGICYGAQLIAYLGGGEVTPAENGSEYGKTVFNHTSSVLFDDVPTASVCFMSHTDYVKRLPDGCVTVATTDVCPCAAFCNEKQRIYAVQFHPEVSHTEYGKTILSNFLFKVCGLHADWNMDDFIVNSVKRLKEELDGKKVLLALSGGVDSSVVAALLHKVVGNNLYCIFVDHGLLRKNEGDLVEKVFKKRFGNNFIRVNAQERFLSALSGVTDPETKRKIIGREFIRVFEEEAKKIGKLDVLAQGTIYPDVIESGRGDSAKIKSHHNVGGLPKNIGFQSIVEPLNTLFKDEVRETGIKLGLPKKLVYRQPFPGPGLAVRTIGEITEEKLAVLREADAIFIEEIKKLPVRRRPSQYFAVITDLKSVGVKGDARSYGTTVVLRAVSTDDFMTVEWTRLPYKTLERAGSRITNEISSVVRVVYDVTSKPPATVEWE